MKFHSNSFADGEPIPEAFAFGVADQATHVTFGPNQNPHFAWNDLPGGTESLALIGHDRDVPTRPDDVNQEGREVPPDLPRGEFFHWVLIDLPPSAGEILPGAFANGVIERGKDVSNLPLGSRQGVNDYTGWFAGDEDMEGVYRGYDGPCPPWNDSLVHHYVFTLYALDTKGLELDDDFTGEDVRQAVEGHVLESASLTGTYALNPRLA